MKFYVLILSMFICVLAFGQEEELEEALEEKLEEKYEYSISFDLSFPFPYESFFYQTNYRFINHFDKLFPPNKIKTLGIKSLTILKDDDDKIPTIKVGKDMNSYNFTFNNNGSVIKEVRSKYGFPCETNYNFKDDTIFRNSKDQDIIFIEDFFIHKYGNIIQQRDSRHLEDYFYDEQGRLKYHKIRCFESYKDTIYTEIG